MLSLRSLLLLYLTRVACLAYPGKSDQAPNDLLIRTTFFSVKGIQWPNSTDVRFFGGIPYAEPPVGSGRFQPPVTKKPVNDTIDASWFGPSCIQYNTGAPTVYSQNLTGFLLAPGQQQSEDCLTLNIWAPRASHKYGAGSGELLPVMIWIHGGGFTSGGAASQYKYGDKLAKEQSVIVVALNYRLNIFGYPNAAALAGGNLNPGLLDQRKAVEWIYQNIHAFGGDAERMILFGQSAGAQAVDKYAYAWNTDPLVKGFVPQSGSAADSSSADFQHSNFTFVASQVGCSSHNKDEELSCMQKANVTAIIEVYNKYNATLNGGKSLSFSPSPDNITSFGNYTDRRARGLFARLPTLVTQTNNEGASLVAFNPAGPNQTAVDAFTLMRMTCPQSLSALARANFDVPVWRTRYFGEWPNVTPYSWLGAYHSSDLPMVFATSELLGSNTPAEAATSRYMQDAWGAFARDPASGLDKYGWPRYDPNANTLIKLGFANHTAAVFGPGDEYDSGCPQ